jgi:transposase
MTEQVGRDRRAVSSVARELGCDWHTVNDTVIGYGAQLVEDPARIATVTALGLDETLFNKTGKFHTLHWATTITDVANHRLIDIVAGRDFDSVVDWLVERPQSWLEAIKVGTLDMAASFRRIYQRVLPQAILVVDPFHLIRLVITYLDKIRRAMQNQTCGHRGRAADPLYRARRLLAKAAETVDQEGKTKLRGLLEAGDPEKHVATAW